MPKRTTHVYRNISKTRIDKLLAEAVSQGAVITGSNPWGIETRLHGVVLRGQWDETAMTLSLSVVDVNWYVPHETVWRNINTLLLGFMEQKKNRVDAVGFE